MTEDLERALRARKEFDVERDRRLEERFLAQERTVTLQLSDMRRQLEHMERTQYKLIVLAVSVPAVVTAIIVYLATASPAG